jgi:hypothetical protein
MDNKQQGKASNDDGCMDPRDSTVRNTTIYLAQANDRHVDGTAKAARGSKRQYKPGIKTIGFIKTNRFCYFVRDSGYDVIVPNRPESSRFTLFHNLMPPTSCHSQGMSKKRCSATSAESLSRLSLVARSA